MGLLPVQRAKRPNLPRGDALAAPDAISSANISVHVCARWARSRLALMAESVMGNGEPLFWSTYSRVQF